jgi:hypothetical protein
MVQAPTSQQVLDIDPGYTDKEIVAAVQRALLAKGYPDVGATDGVLGDMTKDEILAFRQRNNLPLVPIIDDALLKVLEVAPPKAPSLSQIEATPEILKEKVEVVALGNEVKEAAWWTKVWAALTGVPTLLLTLLTAIVDNLDEATAAIQPLRSFFFDASNIPGWVWLLGITAIAGIFGYQAMTISALSKRLEQSAVEGYQKGTIKNDLPAST